MSGKPGTGPRPEYASKPEDGSGKPDRGLSRVHRLTRTSHFQETYAQGRRWVGRSMVFWLREGDGASMRLGVVASKKVGKAPARSRAKRRLREVFRNHRYLFSGEVDVVLIARRAILEATWSTVVEEFLTLARKAGIYKGEKR